MSPLNPSDRPYKALPDRHAEGAAGPRRAPIPPPPPHFSWPSAAAVRERRVELPAYPEENPRGGGPRVRSAMASAPKRPKVLGGVGGVRSGGLCRQRARSAPPPRVPSAAWALGRADPGPRGGGVRARPRRSARPLLAEASLPPPPRVLTRRQRPGAAAGDRAAPTRSPPSWRGAGGPG